ESAEDVRLVLEPRAKTVDPAVLMETLFKLCDLEIRFNLNMNVLIDGRTPKVCSMKEVLRAFLDHRREVLQRRSKHRLEKIDRRLEVLEGYIVAFLNLDRVIEIIRYDDEPKPVLIAEFDLTDVQAEAILNMRLRNLRKLEEMELRRERDDLQIERAELDDLLADETLQWGRITDQLRETRKKFGKDAPGGARRTVLADAPDVEDVPIEAMIEKEPITVVC
ncbi:MAG: DNA gyrase subunit A, partial [Amylibacter sp.]